MSFFYLRLIFFWKNGISIKLRLSFGQNSILQLLKIYLSLLKKKIPKTFIPDPSAFTFIKRNNKFFNILTMVSISFFLSFFPFLWRKKENWISKFIKCNVRPRSYQFINFVEIQIVPNVNMTLSAASKSGCSLSLYYFSFLLWDVRELMLIEKWHLLGFYSLEGNSQAAYYYH